MPGFIGRVAAGVAGGLVGGAVFGILMQVAGALPVVASLIDLDQDSLAIGWAVHMGIAVFVGVTYAVIFGFFSEGPALSMVLGAFYGIIWWVLGSLTLMPLRLGLGLFVFDATAWQSLAGHVAYGLALGLVYAVMCHLLARGQVDATPVIGRPPAYPAGPTAYLAGPLAAYPAGPQPASPSAAPLSLFSPAVPPPAAAPPAAPASLFSPVAPRSAAVPPAASPSLFSPAVPPPAASPSAAAPPSAAPTSLFSPTVPPPPAAPPPEARSRSGLTPLSPQARELRQRGRHDR